MGDTRERILDAAIACLATDGWAATTTRKIVARAGAHVPDVNYYFGTKARLMREAAVRATRRWAQGPLSGAFTSDGLDPRSQLNAVLDDFLGSLRRDHSDAVAAVEAFAQAEHSEPLRRDLARAYEDFRDVVAAGIAGTSGVSADGPTRAVASLLIALFDGLAIQWLLDPDTATRSEEIVDALSLVAMVAASPDASPR